MAQPMSNLDGLKQDFLRTDIGRRFSELTALGWLGRAYLTAPQIFELFAPQIFRLEAYDADVPNDLGDLIFECTLKESSIVGRGIPFCLRLEMEREEPTSIAAATLISIGCDLKRAAATAAAVAGGDADDCSGGNANGDDALAARARLVDLCERINGERRTKRLVVAAVCSAIFGKLSSAGAAVERGDELEARGGEWAFEPRRDLFAREGSAEKWLQQESGYYFADAIVQEATFATAAAGDGAAGAVTRFTFYYDPTEPINSNDPTKNVNPEVIQCSFE